MNEWMKEVFTKRLFKHNLWKDRVTFLPNPKTIKYGTDKIAYKAAQLWSTLSTSNENLPLLNLLKS